MQQKEGHKCNVGKNVINCNNYAYRENHIQGYHPKNKELQWFFSLLSFKKIFFMFVQFIKLGDNIFR